MDPESDTIIAKLVERGGWGLGRLQIDFSIDVYYADESAVRLPVTSLDDSPDTDPLATIPVSPKNAVGFESSSGRACDGGDCHYIVMDLKSRQLIEVWQAEATATRFTAPWGAIVWSFDKDYPASLRGDVCTSADASGGMMAPLLFTAEEVAAGRIDHAIRFILPNKTIQHRQYVRPATHGTGSTGWPTENGVPYGARFRLKPTFDPSGMTAGARVVVEALKKYGMFLSDGGNVALTAKSDKFSSTKWAGLLGARDLAKIKPTDFEMVVGTYGSDRVSSAVRFNFKDYDCVRNP